MRYPEVSDFIAHMRPKNLSPRTIEEYQKVLGSLFKHIKLDDSSPREITVPQLHDYVTSMQQRGLAAKTVSNHVLVIKCFFGFLLAEGYIQEDPSRRIPTPKVDKRLPRALTIPQVQALFMAMSDETSREHRDQVFFKLLYAGGLRVGEVAQIRVSDINWVEGWLRAIGKGDKERRVYLKPYLIEALMEYIEENEVEGYLFPGRGQGHLSGRYMARRLKRYVERVGLPEHVTSHTLRHSAALHYLMGGAPMAFVQNLLGYESPSAPLRTSLATTDIHVQLMDQMAKEITLNTKTAIDEIEPREEGEFLREAKDLYEAEFEGWDDFVGRVLEWL